MTKEQAIKILKADETDDSFDWNELGLKGTEDYNRAWNEAYDMAIKALEQEPCEDAISRNELLKAMDTWDKFGYAETGCFVREPKNNCVKYIHYDDVIKCIKGMPPVQPQPKIGYWKWQLADNGWADHICSECGFKHNTDIHVTLNWQYCPNCGAKMENEKSVTGRK